MTNIFVANLDFGITSEDLETTFSQFGKVLYAHVVYDKTTKKSKGYGYVEMESLSEANTAISILNGMEVDGRMLDIKLAIPKEKRAINVLNPDRKLTHKPNFERKSSHFDENKRSFSPTKKHEEE